MVMPVPVTFSAEELVLILRTGLCGHKNGLWGYPMERHWVGVRVSAKVRARARRVRVTVRVRVRVRGRVQARVGVRSSP